MSEQAFPMECAHIRQGQLDAFATLTVVAHDGRSYRGYAFNDTLQVCPYCLGVLFGLVSRSFELTRPGPCKWCAGRGKTSYGSLSGQDEECTRCKGTGVYP